jgi:hypothetical protein
MTGVLIVGSLANVGVIFTLRTVHLAGLADNTVVVLVLTVALVLLMTWICVLGTELSARVQNVLILAQTLRPAGVRRGGAGARPERGVRWAA